MTDHVSAALGDLVRTARAIARKEGLCPDKTILCWHCHGRKALMPSLACHVCLATHHRRAGNLAPLCVNREQVPEDVEACK